jgi:hypothetical protein
MGVLNDLFRQQQRTPLKDLLGGADDPVKPNDPNGYDPSLIRPDYSYGLLTNTPTTGVGFQWRIPEIFTRTPRNNPPFRGAVSIPGMTQQQVLQSNAFQNYYNPNNISPTNPQYQNPVRPAQNFSGPFTVVGMTPNQVQQSNAFQNTYNNIYRAPASIPGYTEYGYPVQPAVNNQPVRTQPQAQPGAYNGLANYSTPQQNDRGDYGGLDQARLTDLAQAQGYEWGWADYWNAQRQAGLKAGTPEWVAAHQGAAYVSAMTPRAFTPYTNFYNDPYDYPMYAQPSQARSDPSTGSGYGNSGGGWGYPTYGRGGSGGGNSKKVASWIEGLTTWRV